MAASDATPIPVKNQAYRVTFPILDADGDLVTGATSPDSEVSTDGGTFADCTNEATEIATSSGMYYLDLTAAEMNADTVAVIVKSGTGKTTPIVLYPQAGGDDIDVNVSHWNGTALATTNPLPNAAPDTSGGLATEDASGHLAVDVREWLGTAVTTSATTNKPEVDVNSVSDDSTAANNLELDYDGTGYNKSNSTIGTTTTNTDMRGTDNAALASVVGALADAAAAGDPTASDTVMQYVKQLINILVGTTGVTTYPAEAAPANNVSLAEVIRAIHTDVTGLNGDAMRGTDSAALASVCTETRLAELDAANLPTDVANVQSDTDNIQTRLPAALVGGRMDSDIGAKTGNVNLSTNEKADVNAEVVDVLKTDTMTQSTLCPQEAPPVNATLEEAIAYLYKAWRNRSTQTSTTYSLYADDATTVDQKATVSDNGTTADKGEVATGP